MNSGTTLYEEAVALRAEVREVVAILENWNADRHRNHAVRGGATPPGGIRPDDGPAGGDRAQKRWSDRADLDPVPHPLIRPSGRIRTPGIT